MKESNNDDKYDQEVTSAASSPHSRPTKSTSDATNITESVVLIGSADNVVGPPLSPTRPFVQMDSSGGVVTTPNEKLTVRTAATRLPLLPRTNKHGTSIV